MSGSQRCEPRMECKSLTSRRGDVASAGPGRGTVAAGWRGSSPSSSSRPPSTAACGPSPRAASAQAVANAEAVERLERTLGIGWEQAVQSLVLGSAVLVTLANWVYIWGHWPVIIAAATFLYLRRPIHYRVLRNALITSGLIGFVFFYLVPDGAAAPGRDGLVDTVLQHSHAYRALQPPSLTNQYAAMPSLHFGWNLLVGIVLFAAFTSSPSARSPSRCRWRWRSRWWRRRTTSCSTSSSAWSVVAGRARRRRRARAAPGRRRRARAAYSESEQSGAPATATLSRSELARRQQRSATAGVSFLRRAPGRKRPCAASRRRGPRRRSRRGRHPSLPRPSRGTAPEDARPDPRPLGPLAARQSPRAASPARRAARRHRRPRPS